MATSADQLRAQALPIERKVKSLLNADLKAICKSEGLLVSGVKAVLQSRVLERLNDAVETGDQQMLNTLRQRINNFGTPLPTTYAPPITSSYSTSLATDPYRTLPHGYLARSTNMASSTSRLNFKESPFYTIQDALTPLTDLPVNTTRNTVQISLQLAPPTVDRLRLDKTLRVMLYCASDPGPTTHAVEVAFPNQVEVRVNSEVYSGNLRGIKKKPGTTRPADITDLLRKFNGYTNAINVIYAATDRVHNPTPSKYYAIVHIVKKHSVEELLERIKKAPLISKQMVVNEMISKAKDPDIVTTSTVMSLKCPLSTMRMTLPCRSASCSHNQCFDAASYLQIQEQAPQWTCPTCNKTCNFSSLAVDMYVQDILDNVPKTVDQVTIEPDGKWKLESEKDDFRLPSGSAKRKVPTEFDDLIEINDIGHNGFHAISTTQPQATPSREVSRAASSNPRQSSAKKPTEDVIDLTADSDDEEDEPPRKPMKRQSTGSFVGHSPYTPILAPQRAQSGLSNGYSFTIPTNNHNQPNGYGSAYGNWNSAQ